MSEAALVSGSVALTGVYGDRGEAVLRRDSGGLGQFADRLARDSETGGVAVEDEGVSCRIEF